MKCNHKDSNKSVSDVHKIDPSLERKKLQKPPNSFSGTTPLIKIRSPQFKGVARPHKSPQYTHRQLFSISIKIMLYHTQM